MLRFIEVHLSDPNLCTGMVSKGVTRVAVGRKSESGVSLMPVYDIGIPQLHEFDKPKGWSF